MSEKKNIYQKLNNFKLQVEAIKKDKENTYHHNKYADMNDVIEAIRKPLSDAELVDVDTIKKDENGGLWLNTKIIDINNPEEFLEIESPLLFKDKNNPQAYGASLAYMRRYNRVTILGLRQEDDDGNTAVGLNKNTTYPEPKSTNVNYKNIQKNNLNTTTLHQQNTETIRTRFRQAVLTAGLKKEDLADFTKWMSALNYDLRDDVVKKSLLDSMQQLKQLVRDYLEEKKTVEAMGG